VQKVRRRVICGRVEPHVMRHGRLHRGSPAKRPFFHADARDAQLARGLLRVEHLGFAAVPLELPEIGNLAARLGVEGGRREDDLPFRPFAELRHLSVVADDREDLPLHVAPEVVADELGDADLLGDPAKTATSVARNFEEAFAFWRAAFIISS
jgi:hypothetical protein